MGMKCPKIRRAAWRVRLRRALRIRAGQIYAECLAVPSTTGTSRPGSLPGMLPQARHWLRTPDLLRSNRPMRRSSDPRVTAARREAANGEN